MEIKINVACLITIFLIAKIGLSAAENDQWLKSLQPSFAEINKALHEALPMDEDVQRNLEKAKQIKRNAKKSIYTTEAERKLSQAYELFASLTEAARECNDRGEYFLNANSLANEGSKLANNDRTGKVIEYYRREHAKFCLKTYEKEFKKAIASVKNNLDKDDLKQVKMAFEGLSPKDFGLELEDGADSLLIVDNIDFTSPTSSRAIEKLLRQLEQLAKRSNWWPLMKPVHDTELGKEVYPSDVPARLFETHLFLPCQFYRKHLTPILDRAISLVRKEGFKQLEESHVDVAFRQALTNSVMCSKILEHENDLYKLLPKAWSELPVS